MNYKFYNILYLKDSTKYFFCQCVTPKLEESPSLKNYLDESIKNAYPDAVKMALRETQLSATTFPNVCPYSIEELLDDEFYPIFS